MSWFGSLLPIPPPQALETSPAPLAAPTAYSPPFSLFPAGRFSELVSHHFGSEVIQIQHVLEEGIFRDVILSEWWEGENKQENMLKTKVPAWLLISTSLGLSFFNHKISSK